MNFENLKMDLFAWLTLGIIVLGAIMGFVYNLNSQNKSAERERIIDSLSRENKELNNQIYGITSRMEKVVTSIEKISIKIDKTTERNEIVSKDNLKISFENKEVSEGLKTISEEIKRIAGENTELTKENLVHSINISNNTEAEKYFNSVNLGVVNKELNGGYYLVWQSLVDNNIYSKAKFSEGFNYEKLHFRVNINNSTLYTSTNSSISPSNTVIIQNSGVSIPVKLEIGSKTQIQFSINKSQKKSKGLCEYFLLIDKTSMSLTYAVGNADCK